MASGHEQRIDKWLFFARVVKSRSLAQKLAVSGAVRVNREKVSHAARIVRPGDVLTISVHRTVRVLKVLAPGVRRGPPSEAVLLFEDLSPRPDGAQPPVLGDMSFVNDTEDGGVQREEPSHEDPTNDGP